MAVHCVPKTRLRPPSVSVLWGPTSHVAGTFEARTEFFTVRVLGLNGA
jgi:hypothetical protein